MGPSMWPKATLLLVLLSCLTLLPQPTAAPCPSYNILTAKLPPLHFGWDSFSTQPTAVQVPEGTLYLPEDLGQSSSRTSGSGSGSGSGSVSGRFGGGRPNGNETPSRSAAPRPRRVVINYARNCCKVSQSRNCISALKFGADMCIAYNESALSASFASRNSHTLSFRRGGGYWLWKPYVIVKTLLRLDPGDIVLYSDAAQDFIDDVAPLFEAALGEQGVMLGWAQWYTNRKWTKRDAFLLLGCLNKTLCADGHQLQASLMAFRRNEAGLALVAKWLAYAQDPRALTDMGNALGQPNYDVYGFHRHDQSLLALLAIKEHVHGMNAYADVKPYEFDCTVYHHRIRK